MSKSPGLSEDQMQQDAVQEQNQQTEIHSVSSVSVHTEQNCMKDAAKLPLGRFHSSDKAEHRGVRTSPHWVSIGNTTGAPLITPRWEA